MKFLLLFTLLILFTYSLNGQILSGFGVKVGEGFSNQSWVNPQLVDMDYKYMSGLAVRVFADAFDYSFFELEGELGYTRKGFTEEILVNTAEFPDGTGEYYSFTNSFDYLSVSVLAKVKYDFKKLIPYLIAGPQLNILSDKNIEIGPKTFYDDYEKYNLGFSAGIGTEIIGDLPISFLVEYRFEKDFNDNNKVSPFTIKNHSHIFLFGVKF